MRKLRYLVALLVGLSTLISLGMAQGTVYACTQPVGGHPIFSVAERTGRAAVVLEGTVTAVEGQAGTFETATVDVQQYFKGSGPMTVRIQGFASTALCRVQVSVGQHLIFFARPNADGLLDAQFFSFADAVAPISPESLAEVAVALGQGTGTETPTPPPPADPLGGATEFARVESPTDVTVMLDWTPNTNHIGLYVAQAKGYYTEANLNVTIQPVGDVAVEQVVASGRAQFGIGYQEGMTYSRASGLPVVSVGAIIQHNTSGFATLADRRTLRSPADLVGLRYGGFGSAIEKPILEALITCGGATGSVEILDVGFVDPLPLMQQDRIDLTWLFYGWDGIRARQQGQELSILMLSDYTDCVPDYYTPLLMTSEQLVAEQPETVRAFVQATARGYADAIRNPGEAADILLQAAPELDAALVRESAAWLAGQFMADAPRWGEQHLEVWQRFSDFLTEAGALSGPFDPAGAFTNEFLPGK